jgi:hypothetical protein
MNKGDIVRIKATVRGVTIYRSTGNIREIKRLKEPKKFYRTGVVLGYSFIKTGDIIRGRYTDEPNYLRVKKHHRVIVIEPVNSWNYYPIKLQDTNRYLEPVRCLEEDLEIINYIIFNVG